MSNLTLDYDRDFDAWIQQHIALLKQGRVHEIDIEHLITELEDMGRSNLRELESRFIVLIAHLLKWHFQLAALQDKWGEYEGKSWRRTIIEQRTQIVYVLENMPSLKRELQNAVEKSYPKAVMFAVKETRLPKSIFPTDCPYTIEQLLDDDFYPKI